LRMFRRNHIKHLINLSFIKIQEKIEKTSLIGDESEKRQPQRPDRTQKMTFLCLLPNLNYQGSNQVA
jgi:hypothetical protein